MKVAYISLIMIGALGAAYAWKQLRDWPTEGGPPSPPRILDTHDYVNGELIKIPLGATHAQEQLNHDTDLPIKGRVPMGVVTSADGVSPFQLDSHGAVNSNVVTITHEALEQIRKACRGPEQGPKLP